MCEEVDVRMERFVDRVELLVCKPEACGCYSVEFFEDLKVKLSREIDKGWNDRLRYLIERRSFVLSHEYWNIDFGEGGGEERRDVQMFHRSWNIGFKGERKNI